MSREKRTFLICPECGKKGFLGCHYTRDAEHGYMCAACGWKGSKDCLCEFEFYIETVKHFKITWDVIDRIVFENYGHSEGEFVMPYYEFVVNGECSNDSCLQFSVTGEIGKYTKNDAAKFRQDGKPRDLSNGDVLNILCQDGWLEPGEYLVEVCW